jgi:hypothetical protein
LHYLEKSFLRRLTPRLKFDEAFYREIKDLQQFEKFKFLSSYLSKLNYNFESNTSVKSSLERVITFFNNRSKWRELYKAREELLKLNMNFKTIGNDNTKVESNSFNNSKSVNNETEELRVRLFFI